MAMNDGIEKKTPQGEQGGGLKTRAEAEIARLNASIANEEKKINYAYYHIGKKYVDLHAQDYENDFSDMIEYVKASEQRIRAAQKQISELRSPPRCKRCGAELEPDAGFCTACGAPVSYTGPSQQAVNTQPQQRPAQPPVQTAQPPQPRPAQPPLQNTQPPQPRPESAGFKVTIPDDDPAEERRCPRCGTALESSCIYCTECGLKL